jgi:hypothetical protein
MAVAALGATHPTDVSLSAVTPYSVNHYVAGTIHHTATEVGNISGQGETEVEIDAMGDPIIAPAENSTTYDEDG